MNYTLYLACFFIALLGMALQIVMKIKSLQDKAKAANVIFSPRTYFVQDYWSLIASVITIVLFLFFLSEILKWQPQVIDYVKIGFGFIGYTGADVMSKLFGVVNSKINDIINTKTNKADNTSDATTTLK